MTTSITKEWGKAMSHGFAKESAEGEFNWSTTAIQALDGIDLSDRVAIVTGANTGCGKETARALMEANATVIMACRSMTRGGAAREDIIQSATLPDAENRVKLMELDLGDLASVRRFSEEFIALELPCHYLIENAGLACMEFARTPQGLERTFGVNHIGHFYLAQLLLPRLQEAAPSRLIVVSSFVHQSSPPIAEWISFHPRGPKEDESSMEQYSLSKMCNLMFAQEFSRRYKDRRVVAVSLHPGSVNSELGRDLPACIACCMSCMVGRFNKTPEQGAATSIRCVSLKDEEIVPGAYYMDCQIAEMSEDAKIRENMRLEDTPQFRLWELSEKIISECDF